MTTTPPPNALSIHMASQEREFFLQNLVDVSPYFEFGVGGSTVLAWNTCHPTIHGVDSSLDWIQKVTDEIHDPAVQIEHVDLGELKEWGFPVNTKPNEIWMQYPLAIGRVPKPEDIELVLVDGRFRVACFLQALLVCSPSVKILVHDYNRRKDYKVMETLANKVGMVKSLALFEKKSAPVHSLLQEQFSVSWKVLT